MKQLLLGFVVLAAVATAAWLTSPKHEEKAITIVIRDTDTGEQYQCSGLGDGTGTCHYGPASWKSLTAPTAVGFEVKNPRTGFSPQSALVHFVVTQNGSAQPYDRSMPVWPGPFPPEQNMWLRIDDHVQAAAYFGTTIYL